MKFLNNLTFRGSSAVEQLTVNQLVAGSNPAPSPERNPNCPSVALAKAGLFSVKIRKRIFEFFSGWAEGPLPALLRKALQAGGLGGHSTRAKLGAG